MASVSKDPRGGWRISWRESGRQRTAREDSKAKAMIRAQAIERAQAAAKPIAPGVVLSWDEAVDRFLASREGATDTYRQDCRRTLARLLASWSSWNEITPDSVRGLPAYSSRILRAFLAWGAEAGQTVNIRAIAAAKPKATRKPQAPLPSAEDLAAAIAAADRWHLADGTIAHLIATYGHRAESCVGILVRDWEPSGAAGLLTLRVKSGDTIRHPVTAATAARLSDLAKGRDPDAHLLVGHLGQPWTTGRDFAAWWRHSITRRPGLGILDLRRTAITRMLAMGLDPRTIASITGHRTVSLLLNTYARTTESRQSAAISAIERCPEVVR